MYKTLKNALFLACTLSLVGCAPAPAYAASSGIVEKLYVPSGAGAVARPYTAKFTEVKSVNDYGAVGNGIADDTAAFVKALAANGTAFASPGYVYLVKDLTVGAGQRVTGSGTIKGFSGASGIRLVGDGAVLDGVSFNANGAVYAVVVTGKRDRVQGVTFTGNVGHYVLVSGGLDAQVIDNTFDGTAGASITSPVVVDNSNNANIVNNRFFDTMGFGVQVRNNSYGGQVAGNVFRQPLFAQSQTATASQTVFTFTTAQGMARYGVQVNGVPTAYQVSISTPDSKVFTVTFAVARAAGDVIKFIGFRALENVNVNSRVYDLQVIGNDIDGTGDSGIVIGADYHNNVLDANNVTDDDFPARITVRNNKVKNSAYSGIAQTHSAKDCTIDNNQISDNGQITDDFSYSSAILATGSNLSVSGNHISNTLTPPTMKYGVVNNAYPTSNGAVQASQRYSNNTFVGTFQVKYLITNQQAGARRQNVNIEDGGTFDYPEKINLDSAWSNKPNDTTYFSYANSGAGWIYDTTTKIGGTASLQTVAGAYVNIGLPAQAIFVNQIIRVDFMAKNNTGSSYFQIFSSLVGSAYPATINITDTTWKAYTMYFPVANFDAGSVFIRIGGNTGSANIQHIKISGVRVL